MTTPDPGDMTVIGKVVGVVGSIFAGILAGGVAMWKGTNARIAAAERVLTEKADKDRAEKIAENLGAAFAQQREDSQRNYDQNERTQTQIGKLSDSLHAFAQDVTEKLGERPTRSELKEARDDLKASILAELKHG